MNPEEQRTEGKEKGGLIVLVDGDRIIQMWCGTKLPGAEEGDNGADLMVAHVLGSSGAHHLMGRIRLHEDANRNLYASKDRKLPMHLVVAPKDGRPCDPVRVADSYDIAVTKSAESFGLVVVRFDGNQRGDEEPWDCLQRLLEEDIPARLPGWSTQQISGPASVVEGMVERARKKRSV
ncbi:hypothetical protein LCGC14_0663120 [marine sediment metagenome]|uniref:Uncharacterized protein n=1 Tax=marine sediment metagenome TaxID=412755 RepID=A0A0F9QY30_9ZZZZ